MSSCIFCKIISGELPAKIVYRDDKIIAFDDIYPKAPYHKLILPIKHIATLNDVEDFDKFLLADMMITAKALAHDLGIAERGYRLMLNCNKEGGQVIFHIHLHLMGG